MIKCPMCRQLLADNERKCNKCQTDLTLLADYVTHLREGLTQAEGLTRAGELGEAVWAYLSVLEIDPDNATARRQVGKVVTAVRQFDQTAPGRRWLRNIHKQNRFRRWLVDWQESDGGGGFWGWVLLFLLSLGLFVGGYYLGLHAGKSGADNPPPSAQAR